MDAVIFDLDDTLVVEEASARASMAEALTPALEPVTASDPSRVEAAIGAAFACARRRWNESPFSPECRRLGIASWEGLWATFEGCHGCLEGLAEWAPVYRRAAWRDVLLSLDTDAGRSAEVSQRYIDAQRRGHPPIDSAVDAARSVGATMPAGVLTNGPPDIQRLKLSQTGLVFATETVVISAEVGLAKPEPGAFQLALERLGRPATGTVMVGDSWERDILGALNIGMRAVWVSGGRRPPEEVDGVVVVDELSYEAFENL
jgi:HAD superfamily hydrolase (TIGR01549 family)